METFLKTFVVGLFLSVGNAYAEVSSKVLDGGWIAILEQADPFDSSVTEILYITKGDFTFRCGELNVSASSYGYDGLSFGAKLKYVIDSNEPVDKHGGYSSYLGGSDLVTDTRYYYFKFGEPDLESFVQGNKIKVAGKHHTSGWLTRELDLKDFAKNYELMCGNRRKTS